MPSSYQITEIASVLLPDKESILMLSVLVPDKENTDYIGIGTRSKNTDGIGIFDINAGFYVSSLLVLIKTSHSG